MFVPTRSSYWMCFEATHVALAHLIIGGKSGRRTVHSFSSLIQAGASTFVIPNFYINEFDIILLIFLYNVILKQF